MIQQWLDRIPKLTLSLIVVIGTVLVLVVMKPKESICQAQMDVVRVNLGKHFVTKKEDGWTYNSLVDAKYRFCLRANSMGGCFALLQRMNYLEKQARTIPTECAGHEVLNKMEVWMQKTIVLITRLAWGEGPKGAGWKVTGWLDESTVALNCRMTREYKRLFGEARFRKIETRILGKLPGIDSIYQDKRKEKTLFGYRCSNYLR